MRKVISAAVCLWMLAVVISCAAQSAPPSHGIMADPEVFAAKHIAALDTQLKLTGDQKTKLRPIFMEEIKKVQSILTGSLGDDARREAIGRIHSETRDKVESVLTPEQRKRFNDMNSSEPQGPEPPSPGTLRI